jgi:hypothetical protein
MIKNGVFVNPLKIQSRARSPFPAASGRPSRPRATARSPSWMEPRTAPPDRERGPLTIVLRLLLLFVPISLYLGYTHASPTLVFVASCVAILPWRG